MATPNRDFHSPEQGPGATKLFEITEPPYTGGFLNPNLPTDLNMPTRLLRGREKIGDATVNFTLEIPEEITDDIPLGIAPGYMGSEWAYTSLRNYLARNGKPAFTYELPRRQGVRGSTDLSHLLHPQKLPCEALWGTMRNIKRNDSLGFRTDKFDLAGHSRGGETIAKVAQLKHESVRTIILDAAAGLESHNTIMMLGRIGPFFTKEVLPSIVRGEFKNPPHIAALGVARYILQSPRRTLMEGIAVSNADITDLLVEARQNNIKIAMYGYNSDPLISIHRSIAKSGGLVDAILVNNEARRGHLGPQLKSEVVGQDYFKLLQQVHEATDIECDPPFTRAA